MPTISSVIQCGLTVRKTITTGADNANNPIVSLSVGGQTSLNDTSTTPEVEKGACPQIALVAGAKTIDLTAVPDLNGGTVDGTGKKPRALFFGNPSTNAGNITFAVGASNGSDGIAGSWSITLRPGEDVTIKIADTGPSAVSGTKKNIDVTGTGTEQFDFGVIFG